MYKNIFNHTQLKLLILFVILINGFGLFFPLLREDDPVLYANIAKHIVQNHDWVDLFSLGHDWLDKPHFPFWASALSFKIFGINSFAYIVPGFLFNLLGGYYTYRLGRHLYNKDVGLIAALIMLTSLHLLFSSIDVRAEAYLMGEIMPACYYWYKYSETRRINFKAMFLAALFTALALMTKGLFVLVTILSGMMALWLYKRQFKNFIHPKYIIVYILALLLITPELVSLYLQFDLHPEKIVFGHTNVSGIKWYFWGSQFGRFFNDGSIVRTNPVPFHYLFFVHTFFWAFLPWSIVFLVALWKMRTVQILKQRLNNIYLLASFIPTFIIFSITSFQLDYYTNILMPFAAIICANWFYEQKLNSKMQMHKVFYFQIWFAVILTLMVLVLSVFVFSDGLRDVLLLCGVISLILFIVFIHKDDLAKALLYPSLAICWLFIFIMFVYGGIYAKYDIGYQAAKIINQGAVLPVVAYPANFDTLEFYIKGKYYHVKHIDNISNAYGDDYYLVIPKDQLANVEQKLPTSAIHIVASIQGTTIDKVLADLLAKPRLNNALSQYLILHINLADSLSEALQ